MPDETKADASTAPAAPVQTPASKPGYKSTEFWLSAVAAIVGAVMASGAFAANSDVMKVAGMATMALAALGYSVSRGMAKQG